jgi:hypothetical protein
MRFLLHAWRVPFFRLDGDRPLWNGTYPISSSCVNFAWDFVGFKSFKPVKSFKASNNTAQGVLFDLSLLTPYFTAGISGAQPLP